MVTVDGAWRTPRGDARQIAGLIGTDVLASLSPLLHEREAALLGLRYAYLAFDLRRLRLAPDAVGEIVGAAQKLGFAGLNVTHPCKQLVGEHLDELTSEARAINAVNTVVFRDGTAVGHNTDWTGFGEGLRRGLPDAAIDEVVVVGAGGAGSAAVFALLRAGAGHVTVIDEDERRAETLVASLASGLGGGRLAAEGPAALAERLKSADGVVQATPVGMAPHGGLPFDPSLLQERLWVYDIIYRPRETELLGRARALGCRTVNGGPMVVFQAAEALRLFTGTEPDAERMLVHLVALEGTEA